MNNDENSISGAKIDPRWKWHYRALMRLNGRMISERDARRREVTESLAESHKDPADTAADRSERDILFAELGMEDNAIAEVEAALHRIRTGTYGVCEATGKPISPDRLRAIPWTRFCREAAPRSQPRRA
jgi:RNA polymerase-binding transcription factor DksA